MGNKGKMRKIAITFLISLLLVGGTNVLAKEKTVIAILPFTVHSAENIDYVQLGIWDMLISRLSADEKIEVASKDTVFANLKEIGKREYTQGDIYGLGKKMNVDFVVWGSITKIGNNVSIDGRLLDIGTYKSPIGIYAQSQGLDEIIPKISDFAQRILTFVTGGSPAPASSSTPSTPPPAETATPQTLREKAIIAGMKATKKGTLTAIPINPDFISAPQVLDRKDFWMSQQLPFEVRGMDVGDINADGQNEIVVIDTNNVYIFQRKGTQLNLLQKITGNSYDNYLSVDIADINGNGIKEIIVSNINKDIVSSFVLEWKGGKFSPIATKLPYFLRIVYDGSGEPILLGQEIGTEKPFENPIHEIVWDGTAYRKGKKMRIPTGLSVYGLTLDNLDSRGPEKVIAFDDDDFLCVYDKTDKPIDKIRIIGGSNELLWKSDEQFGGSNNFIEPYGSYMGDTERELRFFINPRILTYDTNKDGKKEFIIIKNLSATGRLFKKTRLFTAAEVYNLEWDGMGFVENWRTKKINGYIADYQIKDIDNDGQIEIVLALVLSTGISTQDRSAIVAYKLIPQK